jgi:hypothetical protein
MSPSGQGVAKGGRLFQRFREVKGCRDAIVHLSSSKIEDFRSIDLARASEAAITVLDLVEEICSLLKPADNPPELPFWFERPGADGRFRISYVIPISGSAGKGNACNIPRDGVDSAGKSS